MEAGETMEREGLERERWKGKGGARERERNLL
jgi:hypothetical protein